MKRFILITTLFLCSNAAFAGGVGVLNGGDTVFCVPQKEFKLGGHYTLDYLMTLDEGGQSQSVPIKDADASLLRIRNLIITKYPSLGKKFEEYLNDLSNTTSWTRKRIWLAAPHGLVDVNDEQILRKVPANCRVDNRVALIQTVVRNKTSNIIRYEYDFDVLSNLKNEAPLQYSFLIVHEWLWDFTDNPQVIRWANQFIHSTQAESLSPTDFVVSLRNIGISLEYGLP